MSTANPSNRRKGSYLGTEVDEKWWKRYMKDKFFARGNGEFWFDNTAVFFHRYLTRKPIKIPFSKVKQIKLGTSHAGRWLFGGQLIKLVWEKDGLILSSGFIVSREKAENSKVMADMKRMV